MGAIIQDLSIEKGANFQFDITLTQGDGTIYDLNLYTVSGTMYIDTTAYTLNFTENATLGVATWVLLAGETEVLARGVGQYEIFMTEDATGSVDRLIKGRVYIDGAS